MIPTAYQSGNIVPAKIGGYGKLTDIIRCEIYEELNGDYSIEFDYPVTGRFYEALESNASIIVVGPSGNNEVFDVYKHSVPIDGVVTFFCNHASRRLANYILTGNLTVKTIGTNLGSQVVPTLGGDGMSASISNSTGAQQTVILAAPAPLLSAIIGDGESLAAQGFEIVFSASSHISVSVKTRRGADRGACVRFGANMVNVEYITDETDTYNAFFPFWTDGNGNVTKPTGNAIAQPTTPITPIKAVPLDLTSVYQSQPTSAEMLTYATALLDATTPWVLKKTVSCDLINGTDNELKGTKVELGDTVHVYWSDAGISEDLRVVSYKYDVLAEKYMEIKLGTPQTNFVAVTGINAAGGGGAGGASSISPYDNTPAPLGTAAAGSSDNYSRGDHVHAYPEFTYLGSSSNSSTTVTYPSTAHEILVVGKITHNGGATEYSAIFKVSTIADRDRLQIGGYYYGSSDYGIASVNHDGANHTLAFRNLRYVSTTSGTFYFYYR